MVLRLVVLAGAFLAASPASADRVLLAGAEAGIGHGTIQAHLQSLGHTVTRSDSDVLPASLAPFDSVWVHTLAALSASDIAALQTFVQSGKGVYLNGDRSAAAPGNANAQSLVNATVSGGATIAIGSGACPFVFNGNPNAAAVNAVATTPYAPAYMAFAAAGCIAGAATANQLIAGSGGIRAAAWRDGDMLLGRGRIAIVMDPLWAGLGDGWIDEWVGNLQQFLAGTLFASGFEAGAPGADGILRCDSPVDGSLVDLVPGANIPVSGSALGLLDVRVNGSAVALAPDQTFATSVVGRYGLNFVELSATDAAGASHAAVCAFLGAARWGAEGAQFDEALAFRLEQAGFSKLTSAYPSWFNGPTLQQTLHTSLAGYVQTIGCGFELCISEVRYLSLIISLDSVQLTVTNATTLNFRVQQDLRIGLRVRRKLAGFDLGSRDGEVVFTNAVVNVDVGLYIDPATGLPRAIAAQVNLRNLGTVTTQFAGLEPELIGTVTSLAEDILFSRLEPAVLSGATGLFEGLFAGFETLPAAGFPVQRLDGTGNVMVAFGKRSGIQLVGGGLSLGTGLRITSPAPPPNATGLFPLPPAFQIPSRARDVWSAVHVGAYNQVLQALWRVGLFDGSVDGTALGPGLPAGTAVSVQLGTQPVVTGFTPAGITSLDVGAFDLVVTHPDLPPGLRATAGARIGAQAALVLDDFVFDSLVVDELHLSTGAVTLDAMQRATLQDLVGRALLKVAAIALNDSLPVLPATVFTFPPSLAPYGFTVGSQFDNSDLAIETPHVFLQGIIGDL